MQFAHLACLLSLLVINPWPAVNLISKHKAFQWDGSWVKILLPFNSIDKWLIEGYCMKVNHSVLQIHADHRSPLHTSWLWPYFCIHSLNTRDKLQRPINLQTLASLGCWRKPEGICTVTGKTCKHHTGTSWSRVRTSLCRCEAIALRAASLCCPNYFEYNTLFKNGACKQL